MPRIPRDWDDDDEEIDVTLRRNVRRAPAREFLDVGLGGALRRSRSTGARPEPNVIVIDNHNDANRSPSRDRDRDRDRSRGRRRFDSDDDLRDAVEDVAREIRRNRSRTPAPIQDTGRRDLEIELLRERRKDLFDFDRERERLEKELERDRLDYKEKMDYERQLERTRGKIRRLEDQLHEEERESKRKEEKELILLERDREERERKEKERVIKLELERKEHEEEEREKRLLAEYREKESRKKRDKEESEALAVAAYEKKKEDKKREREEMVRQIKAEEEEKKRKEKEEEERWRIKLEEKKREEEQKKKHHQEELDEEMRKKLHKFGFQENQVDAILDPKKAPKMSVSYRQSNALVPVGGSGPTYIKIHKNHVDIETLKYFGLPWGYDPSSSDYYLIFQEMDSKETEILFEHTRKLRKRTTELLIEDRGRKGEPHLAFVRRRTPSASPSRGKRRESPKRILKLWP